MEVKMASSLAFVLCLGYFGQGSLGQTVFSVARSNGWSSNETLFPVNFDIVNVNQGGAYNTSNHVFRATNSAVYMFSFGAGAATGQYLYYSLIVGSFPVFSTLGSVVKTTNTHSGIDMATAGAARYVNRNDEFRMNAEGETAFYSDSTGVTSFSGMQIRSNTDVFCMARTTPISGYQMPLEFDTMLVNMPLLPWDFETHTFVAEYEGVYFFKISGGTSEFSALGLAVMVNGEMNFDLIRSSTNHNHEDTMSRSGLVYLRTGDVVAVRQNSDTTSYSDGDFGTMLTGFQVSHAVIEDDWPAMFVGRTSSWSGSGTFSPLPMDNVRVNQGGMFNILSHQMEVTQSGNYFISISGGLLPGQRLGLSLRRNGVIILTARRETTAHNGSDVISRDVIMPLVSGDRLYLEASGGTGIFGNSGLQTSLLAFRVPV